MAFLENKSLCAEILCVGTELLLGDILNTNAQFLSKQLALLGIGVHYQAVVGDNPQRLEKALHQAIDENDIVITTGGLGPTQDDLTKEIVCQYLHIPLIEDAESLRIITSYYNRSGRKMPENNLKQAMVPQDAVVLQNEFGTAPGCIIEKDGKIVILLPGPPREMRPMFLNGAFAFLQRRSGCSIISKTLRVTGIGESALELKVGKYLEGSNPTAALYAKTGEVHIRITAKGETPEQAEEMCGVLAEKLRQELGIYLYHYDDCTLAQCVVELLRQQKLQLATAESCTGGLVAKKITDIPGSSGVFECGIVSYANRIKNEILGVSQTLLHLKGAVCKDVAEEMARGVLQIANADIGIGITGIAGPDGGSLEKPVGLVYVALAEASGKVWSKKLMLSHKTPDREYIRELASIHVLDMVRRYIIDRQQQTHFLDDIAQR